MKRINGLRMKISSRVAHDPVAEMKMELAEAVADELDELVEKINDFLEIRIAEEFNELNMDIRAVAKINEILMEENIRLGNKVNQLQGGNGPILSDRAIQILGGSLRPNLLSTDIVLTSK